MRPALLNPLFAEVTSLPGVGPALARRLEALDIRRVRDLLFHLPVGWLETRAAADLAGARTGERIAIDLTILQHQPAFGRAPTRVASVAACGTPLALVFFGRPEGQVARLPTGARRQVTGVLEQFQGRWQMVHPEAIGPAGAPVTAHEPVYPLTQGLSRRQMAQLVQRALGKLPALPEWIDPAQRARAGWPSFAEAIAAVHSDPSAQAARDRLAYDELLAGQLAWALVRARARARPGRAVVAPGAAAAAILAALPFEPTAAQQRALGEILADMARPAAMLRLLQGDVGAGKTLVAALALAAAAEAGGQGALLAPTEILARQHADSLATLFAPAGLRLGFLSGREKGRAREAVLAALGTGEIDVLVGTHAIFQPGVAFRDLALAVIDEQHRFGVAQRLMLQSRAEVPPHVLVMTATPIPRTLALARFGEMDLSVLDTKPPGRTPVDTRVIALARLEEVLDGLGRQLAAGHQAYWVCPRVEGDEAGDAAATERASMLEARFPGQVALVHGRMAGPARDAAMARFAAGAVRLLVATTVIEVGVDVPAASLMVIEAAERFGLAQLHQLRGRVGRGAARSVCLLLVGEALSETARARLKMMRETDDGFAIAEADLKLRGPGELLGTRQSGERQFELASEAQAAALIAAADADARLLVAHEGGLAGRRGEAARLLLYLFGKDEAVQTLRSG